MRGATAFKTAPRRRWWALRTVAAAAFAVGLAGLGCTAEGPSLDPLPLAKDCACVGGVCPVSVCDVAIEVEAATCKDEVGKVEIMLGATLEPTLWVPGVTVRSCATIARGTTIAMVARADTAWTWAEDIACPAAAPGDKSGVTIERILHCATGK